MELKTPTLATRYGFSTRHDGAGTAGYQFNVGGAGISFSGQANSLTLFGIFKRGPAYANLAHKMATAPLQRMLRVLI